MFVHHRSMSTSLTGPVMRRALVHCTIFLLAAACSAPAPPPAKTGAGLTAADSTARDSAAHQAHANYVRVINSNNIDSLASMLTDDVIFLAANDKPIVGKAAVRAWVDGYYKAFHTKWEKPVQEFVVSGDYAFERYSYTSTDTPVGGGKPVVDTGWGFVVYHRDADGVWRVARDAFGPDHPPATK
jgi:ketosteroid isomerase-like protein